MPLRVVELKFRAMLYSKPLNMFCPQHGVIIISFFAVQIYILLNCHMYTTSIGLWELFYHSKSSSPVAQLYAAIGTCAFLMNELFYSLYVLHFSLSLKSFLRVATSGRQVCFQLERSVCSPGRLRPAASNLTCPTLK